MGIRSLLTHFATAVLIPVFALILQWSLWDYLAPYVWFFFFPAVFFSSRISGLWSGLISTLLSTLFVWYFFITPELSWAIERPGHLWAAIIFIAMGILFSDSHQRLRRTVVLEEDVLQREAELSALFSSLPVGITILDRNMQIVKVNNVLTDILQLSLEELKGKKYAAREYYNSEGQQMKPSEFPSYMALAENKTIHNFEIGIKSDSEKMIWTSVSAAPLNLPGMAVLLVTVDITKRKEMEVALAHSEIWFKGVFNSLEEGVMVINADRAIYNANIASQRIFGYTEEELKYLPPDALHVDEAHFFEFRERIQRAYSDEHGTAFEFEAKRKNGEIFPSEHAISLLKDSRGNYLGVVSVIRDITEQKKAKEELERYKDRLEDMVKTRTAELAAALDQIKDAEHRQRLILESLPAGVVVSSGIEQKIVYQNPHFRNMFGYSMDQPSTLYKLWTLAYPDEKEREKSAEEWNRRISAVRVNEAVFDPIETSITTHDRTRLFVSLHATTIGELTFITFIDLSERKRAEEAILASMEKERLLIQQSRLAAMGEMIGNIAHQWRQPLNILALIQGNLMDAFEFGELDQETMKTYDEENTGIIQQMSRTIDEFRDFFKPDKTKLLFRASEAIDKALAIIDASLQHNNIVATVQIRSDKEIYGYETEFSQVVLNIMSNAKNAFHERKLISGTIQISVDSDDKDVIVSVLDNAGGVPKSQISRIFEPYFTTSETGTGIGLYMSRMIMEHMEGRIEFKNKKDGAEFRLILPFAENLSENSKDT